MTSGVSPSLYVLPTRERDPLSIIFRAVGAALWLALIVLAIATQSTAWALGYSAALGPPLIGHWYAPFSIVPWCLRFGHVRDPAVHAIFLRAYLILAFGGSVATSALTLLVMRRLARLHRGSDLCGSAHFATEEEVEASGLLAAAGVYVGAWRDPRSGQMRYLRDESTTHCAAIMPTGSGKTAGFVIPTMLSWPHSAIVYDLKGEIWQHTAGWRAAPRERGGLGQRVVQFNPAAASGSARLNPLDLIRVGTDYDVQDTQNVVSIIAGGRERPTTDDANRFFDIMGQRYAQLATVHVLYDKSRSPSLPGVAALLGDPTFADAEALLEYMRSFAHDPSGARGWRTSSGAPTATHPLVTQIATEFLQMEPRVRANVIAEAQSFLTLYADPIVAANIETSDFDVRSLADGNATLYLVVPPAQKVRLRPLIRLVLAQTVLAQMREASDLGAPRTLVMLDEFGDIGAALEAVRLLLTIGRGYRLKGYLIAQDFTQLEAHVGRGGSSLLANCAVRIASAPNDMASAEMLSRMCGTMTVRHTVRNYSGSRFGPLLAHTMASDHDVARPLLTPDEMLRLPAARKGPGGEVLEPGNVIVFAAGHAPILGVTPFYFHDRTFRARAAIAPPSAATSAP